MTDSPGLRERIRRSETLLGTFANLGSPMAAELLGAAGLDWVLIDLEHGAGGESDLLSMLHAVGTTPATPIVRVEEGTRLRIGRALDMGAPAIMIPRVESAEEAARVASYLRYPPTGIRGVALPTRGAGYGAVGHDAVGDLDERVTGIFQVESAESVDAAVEIAQVDGVDVLFVGPTDLSHALGIPGQVTDPRYQEAIARVGRAAADAGKAAGVLLWQAGDAPAYIDAGYRFLGLGSDGVLVANGARALSSALREAVASRADAEVSPAGA